MRWGAVVSPSEDAILRALELSSPEFRRRFSLWLLSEHEDDPMAAQTSDVCLLPACEVARRLGKSEKTIQRWAREGRFSGAEKIGRTWRIPAASLASISDAPRATPTERLARGEARGRVATRRTAADSAFDALGASHGATLPRHKSKSAPRDAPTSGGPGTGRKEASTMKHATAGSPAHANVHAIDRKGRR